LLLRPCFLVVDREFAGSISTRKLVIETAKFNVITAYSFPEALSTLEIFPRVSGCVVSASHDDASARFLRAVRSKYPEVKLVMTGHNTADDAPCDVHVEGYAPDKLLDALRGLFPGDSENVKQTERMLEKEAGEA
jgi:hypothetical protein